MSKSPPPPLSWSMISTAKLALSQVTEVLESNFLSATPSFVREASFTYLIIRLHDVLSFLDRYDRRVTFRESVDPAGKDVTDLVGSVRNAACHQFSGSRNLFETDTSVTFMIGHPRSKVTFNRYYDPFGTGKMDSFSPENPFDDDVAIYYGRNRVFYFRHIMAACVSARDSINILEHALAQMDSSS